MSTPTKLIIDTDPGIDDVLALLLALSASPEDVEILLISVTFGNVEVQNCLRNVAAMFHVIEKELRWRREHNLPEGFEAMRSSKPIVAVGADRPLGDQTMLADYFHGIDGLGGIHETHPHHSSPEESWKHLFDRPPPDTLLTVSAVATTHAQPKLAPALFTPSTIESHFEILRILSENPPDTITIIAIGPLTNIALAAAEDPTTFLRVKAVLLMGGAVSCPGNITPVGEFNALADAYAAARVFALTSPDLASTMPPPPPPTVSVDHSVTSPPRILPPYPPQEALGDRRLNLILFSLDVTTFHTLRRDEFIAKTAKLVEKGSPLAEWTTAFLSSTFHTVETLHEGHEENGMDTFTSLHDPVCVWYAITAKDVNISPRPTFYPRETTIYIPPSPSPSIFSQDHPQWILTSPVDIRIETQGQWTRGMCVIDRRDRKMLNDDPAKGEKPVVVVVQTDHGDWLSARKGNRVRRCVGTPGNQVFAGFMLDLIFGK